MTESAIIALKKEMVHLYRHILFHNLKVMELEPLTIIKKNGLDIEIKTLGLAKDYENIKKLQSEILTYAAGVQMKELTKSEFYQIDKLFFEYRVILLSV